jgi:hypothetical protein
MDPSIHPDEPQPLSAHKNKTRLWREIICEDVPFVNLVYDLLFDALPTPDGVKDALNLIGLIDALFIGLVVGILTSCSYDETILADERFMTESPDFPVGYHHLYMTSTINQVRDGGPSLSAKYAFNAYMGIVFFFVSLLSDLAAYLDFSNKDFSKEIKFIVWWSYARYCIFISFATLIFGIFYSAATIVYVIYMKFPDYKVARHGVLGYSMHYPYGNYLTVSLPLLIVLGISLFLLGLGTKNSYRLQREMDLEEECVLATGVYQAERDQWTSLLKDQTRLFPDDISSLVSNLETGRVYFEDRKHLTEQHLIDLGVTRLGDRLNLLSVIHESGRRVSSSANINRIEEGQSKKDGVRSVGKTKGGREMVRSDGSLAEE